MKGPYIRVVKLNESGYNEAAIGLSLSHNQRPNKMKNKVMKKLFDKDGGHNKFLEHIYTWWLVDAPRYWWSEADTYRLSSKQSESTMHTLIKELRDTNRMGDLELFEEVNFEEFDFGFDDSIRRFIDTASVYSNASDLLDFEKAMIIKSILPESFIQTRVWVLNYKTLRNIILQRKNHKLSHWKMFCEFVLGQIDHPELIKCNKKWNDILSEM